MNKTEMFTEIGTHWAYAFSTQPKPSIMNALCREKQNLMTLIQASLENAHAWQSEQ